MTTVPVPPHLEPYVNKVAGLILGKFDTAVLEDLGQYLWNCRKCGSPQELVKVRLSLHLSIRSQCSQCCAGEPPKDEAERAKQGYPNLDVRVINRDLPLVLLPERAPKPRRYPLGAYPQGDPRNR